MFKCISSVHGFNLRTASYAQLPIPGSETKWDLLRIGFGEEVEPYGVGPNVQGHCEEGMIILAVKMGYQATNHISGSFPRIPQPFKDLRKATLGL